MNTDSALRFRRAPGIRDSRDLDRFRRLLEDRQADLVRTSGSLFLDQDRWSEPSRGSDDLVEQAAHHSEQDQSLEILERAKRELEDIVGSLERLDEGRYGLCEECEK